MKYYVVDAFTAYVTNNGRDCLLLLENERRGAVLYCENRGERVKIAGKAALYLQGEIYANANP
ncbi:MAG: hypothetical protein FWH26_06675 [Oscillospiraceae bacterium]|nr:hypothetical protein [Oscillospiraceae bacterium]